MKIFFHHFCCNITKYGCAKFCVKRRGCPARGMIRQKYSGADRVNLLLPNVLFVCMYVCMYVCIYVCMSFPKVFKKKSLFFLKNFIAKSVISFKISFNSFTYFITQHFFVSHLQFLNVSLWQIMFLVLACDLFGVFRRLASYLILADLIKKQIAIDISRKFVPIFMTFRFIASIFFDVMAVLTLSHFSNKINGGTEDPGTSRIRRSINFVFWCNIGRSPSLC